LADLIFNFFFFFFVFFGLLDLFGCAGVEEVGFVTRRSSCQSFSV